MFKFTDRGPKHRTENRRAMIAGSIANAPESRPPKEATPMSNDAWRVPPTPRPEPIRPRLMTTQQACVYIGGMSRSGFFAFRKRWSVPAVQLAPKVLRFDVADLDAAIERAKAVPAVPNVDPPAVTTDPPTAVAAEPAAPDDPPHGSKKAKRGR